MGLLLTVMVLTIGDTSAQIKSLDGYGVEVNPFAGKIIKHNPVFPPVPATSGGVDINILRKADGSKDWHIRRNYPLFGLGLTYTNYGLNNVYGTCIGVYPVWQFRLVGTKRIELTTRFGIGIGYVTGYFKRHDKWDTLNNLIGSAINNFSLLSTDVRYHITNRLSIQAGLTASHISNGEFRRPNLGVNFVGGHIGVRYFPVSSSPTRINREPEKLSNRWLLQLRLAGGLVEYGVPDGPFHKIYLPSVFISKRYNSKNKILAGVDYAFYESVYMFLKNNEIYAGEERKRATEMSAFLGHEFLIGRIGLVMQVGYPFKRATLYEGNYVTKLGYNYYLLQKEKGILKEATIHTYIKTDKLKASVIELGVGLSF